MEPGVLLIPLSLAHVPGLHAANTDPADTWRYMVYGLVQTETEMRALVVDLLARQARGTDEPFTVIEAASGRILGMTRYLNIDPANASREIGGTWYAPDVRGTLVNTHCKYQLLARAFEDLACERVQFKADARNLRSLAAIERLGAVREGVLRHHLRLLTGEWRDSVIYSILASEWPAVRARLRARLAGASPHAAHQP